ncbi:MAG TPA: FecR domain-containing protein [Halanaerobiales bacterium]|nr:FecR domain-containing protein [Halanaerobiales bacterium]
MKKTLTIILISLITLTTLTAAFAQQTEEKISINMNSLKGIIYRKTDQGFFEFFRVQVWTRLLDNATISQGETIKTAPDSLLTLNIGGNNKVELQEETILKIGDNITPEAQKLNVKKGRVIINTNINPEQKFNIEIETPESIIKTSHAMLKVEVNDYRTLLFIEEGEVTLMEKTTLQEVNLTETQIAIVENNEIKKYQSMQNQQTE